MATDASSDNEQIVVEFGGTSIAGESSRDDVPPGAGAGGEVESMGIGAFER